MEEDHVQSHGRGCAFGGAGEGQVGVRLAVGSGRRDPLGNLMPNIR